MKHNSKIKILLVLTLLLLVSLACGGSNTGTLITPTAQEDEKTETQASESEPVETEQNEEPPAVFQVYEIGDLVEIKEHSIRLNGINYQNSLLVADFSIENFGDHDIDINSALSFSAKKSDGTLLKQELFDCLPSVLNGKVLSGDRLRGRVCWGGAIVEDENKIYYEANLFGEGAIVWDAIEGVAEPVEYTEAQLRVDIFNVGDVVQMQDHIIILNSVDFKGNMLKANFTIENQGSSDLAVSSLFSFYARKIDGLTLKHEYIDCRTPFDGSVIPGDKLRGDICWSGAMPDDGIKIYYQAKIFGSGAVVWLVE